MDDLFVIKDGERFKVNIINNFKFNGNLYCVYSIANTEEEDRCDIYCGKIVEGVIRNIEDEQEKRAVDTIVKDIFDSVDLENEEHLDTIEIMRNDEPVTAEVLDVMEINGDEYFLLSVDNDNDDMSDIFATKVLHIGDKVKYISLTSDEQELVLDTLDDILE